MTRIAFAALVALTCGALTTAQTTNAPSDNPRENTPAENLAINSERPSATLSDAISRHTQIMTARLRGGSPEESDNTTSGTGTTTGATTGTTGSNSLSGLSGLLGNLGGLSGLSGLGNLGSLAGLLGSGSNSSTSSASGLSALINQLVASRGGSATSRVRDDTATASPTATAQTRTTATQSTTTSPKTQLVQQTATDDRPFRTRLIDGALSTFFDVFTNDFIQPVLTEAFRGFLRDALRPLFGLTDETDDTSGDGTNGDGSGGGSQI